MNTLLTNHGAFLGATRSQQPFQLPPPPPGMQWHRTDGWEEGDLPPGYRPHTYGEGDYPGDEVFNADQWRKIQVAVAAGSFEKNNLRRTTRPLTFAHEGKTWTWHRPGDPMPCDGAMRIKFLMKYEDRCLESISPLGLEASTCNWVTDTTIIGWRYANETIPLGPEDVPPGSAFRHKDWLPGIHRAYAEVNTTGVNWSYDSGLDWMDLKDGYWQINRSIPLTGKWNPDAWELCSKSHD